jgi:hypothetical protein
VADPLGVSVAFDDPPLQSDPFWTRIDTLDGCRVRGWTIDRGRSTEFDKTGTGTAVIRIVDRQGLFDPTNPSSPYNGKLTPGKQAAVALQNPTGAHAWFTLFRGFIETWTYQLDPTRQYMELELQLVDGFALLARAQLRVGIDGLLPVPAGAAGNVVYGETTGTLSDRITAILDDAGWPADLAVIGVDVFSGNVQVGPKAYGPGTSALDALWDAADAEFPGVANLWVSKEGHLVFHGRQARFQPDVAEYGINQRTVGDPSATSHDPTVVPVAELEWVNGQDNLVNAASATPQGIGLGSNWRQLNPGPPNNDDVAGQYVKDDTSIDAYGLRSVTYDQLQTIKGIATGNNSMVETKLFADYYVQNYKTPAPRVSRMVFKSRRPDDVLGTALWGHLCACEISDLLTLKTRHPGGGGFDTDFYVEGLHYTGSPGSPDVPVIVELTLDVSPRAHYTTNPFPGDHLP